MIGLPPGTQVWLAAGVTDMRRGFDGLAAIVQTKLADNPYGGQVFVVFVMTVAAAEAAVGLAIIISIFRHRQTVNLSDINLLKG